MATDDAGEPSPLLPETDRPDELAGEPMEWARPVPDVSLAVPLRPPHPGFWWSVLWCAGYVIVIQTVLVVVGVLVLVMILFASGPNGMRKLTDPNLAQSPEYATAMLPAMLCAQLVAVLGSWLSVRLVVGREWPRVLAVRAPAIVHVVLVCIAMPAVLMLNSVLDIALKNVLQRSLGRDSLLGLDQAMQMFEGWPWFWAILAIGIGPGLAEELFFRGLLGRGLVARYGPGAGVLLTSLLFGLVHLEPRQVIIVFLLGLALHGVYLATRSLWIPILIHVLNNTTAILAPTFSGGFAEWEEGLDTWSKLLPVGVGAALLLAGVGWALHQTRARLVPRPDAAVIWQPDFPGVEWPPHAMETDVTHVRPTLGALVGVVLGVLAFAAGCYWASMV